MSERVFIALGSNVGDRANWIDRAIEKLSWQHSGHDSGHDWGNRSSRGECRVIQYSSLWETDPVGPPQPRYLNAAAELSTTLSPLALLQSMLEIEESLGRVRSTAERNAPRTIDLDLLMYGTTMSVEPHLELPHPRLTMRPFVLIPLLELDASLRHPGTGDLLVSFLPVNRENDGVVMWRARSRSLGCAEVLGTP